MAEQFAVPFPFAFLVFTLEDDVISQCRWQETATVVAAKSPLEQNIVSQCQRYQQNPNFQFSLPVIAAKSPLHQRFRDILNAVPAGQAKTYGEIAALCQSHPRAVGQLCRHNPLPLLFPCHRVFAANDIGGYCGDKIELKQALLAHEGYSVTP